MQERLTRARRRQILKEDEPWIGKALNLKAIGRGMQANTRHIVLTLLDTGLNRRASRAAAFAGDLLDVTLASQVQAPFACAKGCSHCCRTFVSATVPEILLVAHPIRAKPPTRERVTEAAAQCKAIPESRREIERVQCPILDDHACSEYKDRPLVCRSVLSNSLEACVRIFRANSGEPFPHAGPTLNIRAHMVVMMQAALMLSGLPHKHYELNQALAVALSRSDAEEQWLAGEPLFAGVAVDSADASTSPLTGSVQKLVATLKPTI